MSTLIKCLSLIVLTGAVAFADDGKPAHHGHHHHHHHHHHAKTH